MERLCQYALSVISAAVILGILKGIWGGSPLMKLVGGLFLTLVILQPLARFDFSDMRDYYSAFSQMGSSFAAQGELQAAEAGRSIIKEQVEAYILDKAKDLGAQIQVSVELGEDDTLVSACLEGAVSPYTKAELEQILEAELAIAKENQLWIG